MRVVLADDSGLFRDLLARTLADGGHQVVGVAGGADEVLGLVNATGPDVVVMDIRMPPTCTDDGLQAALRLRARHPQVGVVLLSQHGEVDYAMRLVAGVPDRVGYLLKERATGARELLDALERVAAGGAVIDPDLVARMLTRPRVANPLDKLTERERETLALMAEGFGNAATCGTPGGYRHTGTAGRPRHRRVRLQVGLSRLR